MLRTLILLSCAGAVTGCYETQFGPGDAHGSDQQSVGDGTATPDNVAPSDGSTGGDSGGDSAEDATATDSSGGDTPVASNCTGGPGSAGCVCAADGDCTAGVCLPTADGKQCAVFCTEGNCQADHVCGAVEISATTGGPVTKYGVCLPRWPTRCLPCQTDSVCSHAADKVAACIDLAGGNGASGRFCADACKSDSDCPTSDACLPRSNAAGDVQQVCVPKDSKCSCSGLAIELGAATACARTAPGKGVCKGSLTCSASGLSDCSAPVPVAEACNGLDDDCDGATDEVDATPLCDDNNPCTDDSCGGGKGCVYLPNTATCSDGDACTNPDACSGCKCTGEAAACEDLNPCTSDNCDSEAGCIYVSLAVGCDDGSACTNGDTCTDGSCKSGATITCDDGNACTNDWCDAGKGCVFLPNDATCDDGNSCTGVDVCSGGKCQGPSLACDDGWGCTTDTCDGATGCSFTVKEPGCGKATLPYAAAFGCDDPAVAAWHVTAAGIGMANPQPPPLQWAVDALPQVTADGSCTLNMNNGKDLACGLGQSWINQTADSPVFDATGLASGAPIVLQFESAGSWAASQTAKVFARIDGGAFDELAKPPATGLLWGKAVLDVSKYAGQKFQIRFAFTAPDCTSSTGGGWFLRNFKLAVDPCATSNGGCAGNATCSVGANNAAVCTCMPGYTGNGTACSDIDECKNGTAKCANGSICSNTPGSYSCGCAAGYTGDGKVCTDVDECALNTAGCSADATCTNKPGSYTCTCKKGYTGNGKTCTDIDECALKTAGCSTNADCTNLPGTAQCTCKPGFAGDGKTCSDVDECSVGLADCATDATCSNTTGSFACKCNAGYLGSGKTCTLYGSQDTPAPTCKAIKNLNPAAQSGNYWLAIASQLVNVPCDMVTDGGGWTVIQYKADLPFAKQSASLGWVWLTSNFQTVLTADQIKALQAQSTEGRQLYVGLCNRMVHYKYAGSAGWERAFGFRFLDQTETVFGQQFYAPHDITVPQDGCMNWASENGQLSKSTNFLIKSTKVPVINVRTNYNQYNAAKFGSPLKQNPAMLR
ncbi:MAG: hypothetical protein HY902_03745 [Deltaproteobacteria bacterium]|nr:hypothetical protein [Deltaproteobacteria bacterium]